MYKKWVYSTEAPRDRVLNLAQGVGIDVRLAGLLWQRGVRDEEEMGFFIRPWQVGLHDGFLMRGMEDAVKRVCRAIDEGELMCIYGDYDVDGTTSVALLYKVLSSLGARVYCYVPDRYEEGYGLSLQGVKQAIDQRVGVLLCVDCGTKAVDLVAKAKRAGIDTIICDHHEPGNELPDAVAMLNPKQADCDYPFKELSACGIAYKFLQALVDYKGWDSALVKGCIDLVAVSIAADIVPMTGENRVLAYYGLQCLNSRPNMGLKALMDVVGRRVPLSIADIVFGLAPCINAAGRLSHAKKAIALLLAEGSGDAFELAKGLFYENRLRREMDEQVTGEALGMVAKDGDEVAKRYSHVLYKEDWHKGILGIVASRCIEHYYKPTVLLTKDGDEARGSGRSVPGYNLYRALEACAPLLSRYGGHAFAVGLCLPCDQVGVFADQFERTVAATISEEHLVPIQRIDLVVCLEEVNTNLFNLLQQLAPFGPENRRPVLSSYPVICKRYWVYQKRHLKLHIQQDPKGKLLECIGFNMAESVPYIQDKKPFTIAYTLQETYFQNIKSLQLVLKDLRPLA